MWKLDRRSVVVGPDYEEARLKSTCNGSSEGICLQQRLGWDLLTVGIRGRLSAVRVRSRLLAAGVRGRPLVVEVRSRPLTVEVRLSQELGWNP